MAQAHEHSAFNQQINAIEWGPLIEPTYGFYAVQQNRPIIIHKGKGASTTLPILKKSEFEKLEIPCPALALQIEFAERIAAVRNGSSTFLQSLGQFNALFDSLQHHAFRGEL
jgi:type I restriction enzyme S subunit